MIEKNIQEAKIRHGLSAKRASDSYQTIADITIPAGTLLRGVGDDDYACAVGIGGVAGTLMITVKPGTVMPAGSLKRVIAS